MRVERDVNECPEAGCAITLENELPTAPACSHAAASTPRRSSVLLLRCAYMRARLSASVYLNGEELAAASRGVSGEGERRDAGRMHCDHCARATCSSLNVSSART